MHTLRKTSALVVGLAVLVVALAACVPALSTPGNVAGIRFVSTQTVGLWRYDFYRNRSYPCSISGYQTFTIATKLTTPDDATRPLWTWMHGGGVGFFSSDGLPRPDEQQKVEETPAMQRDDLRGVGVMSRIRSDPAGFRMLAVSMCDHDIYGGPDVADPNNPNTTPDGKARTVNGLFATKAAIQFALAKYPTDDNILYGGSAGSFGTFNVAWGLEQQGLAPAGAVSDSGVLNTIKEKSPVDFPCERPAAEADAIAARLHPDIIREGNNPDELVASGRLTVPILHIWDRNDTGDDCDTGPGPCPLRDGSIVQLRPADCTHAPLAAVIAAQGAASRSKNMRLCVDDPNGPLPCDRHVPTRADLLNTDPAFPADYNGVVIDWVHSRLADD